MKIEHIVKKCSGCSILKPHSEFYKDKAKSDGLTVYCKDCKKKKKRTWSEANPEKVKTYNDTYLKGERRPRKRTTEDNLEYVRSKKIEVGSCQRCGYDKYPEILQYHHVDPTTKSFMVGKPGLRSIQLIEEEIAKCVIICPTCHWEIHHEERLK